MFKEAYSFGNRQAAIVGNEMTALSFIDITREKVMYAYNEDFNYEKTSMDAKTTQAI